MTASLDELRERLDRAHALRAAQGEPLTSAVRKRLPEAAEALRSRLGARRVLLFGSFARGTPLTRSDVDIAVEGVAARDQFRAMAMLTRALEHTVDLVRLEDLEPADRERLESEAEPA